MSSKAAGTRFFKNPAGLRQKRRGNGGNRPDKTNREGTASFGRTLITGFFIGIGAIAPGISGGAIAVIFGLYDRIADAIAHFYRGFREKMRFLLPLCLGGGAGVLLFSQVISWLFAHYNTPVRILFIGLMAGTLPSLFRTAAKEGFRRRYLLAFFAAAAATAVLGRSDGVAVLGGTVTLSFPVLVACGAVIGFGTIVPGVSSSFLLMAAGLYEPLMQILTSLEGKKLLPLGLGFVLFVLLFAKAVSYLYRKAYGWTSFTVAGLLVGSIVPVIPAQIPLDWFTAGACLLAVSGGWLSWYLLKRKEDNGLTHS